MSAFEVVKRLAERWRYRGWPLCILAILLLSLVAVWPLLSGDLILSGDTSHAVRIHQMHQCLSDGQLPCRWTPDLGNGYGYPLFNYYPPLPYYVGALLHAIGFSYLMSANLLAVIGLIGASLSMYALARRFWGEAGGLVSGVAYLFAPYLALDVYMRGAIAELWALAIAPLLFLAAYELIGTGKARWLVLAALSGALLLLSHNLVALIVAPALALWAIVFLGQRERGAQRALLLGLAGCWAVGLAAFFTLPVLFEGDLVQLDTLTRYPFHYSGNFASLRDLFFLRSSDYSFLLGARDGPPLQIGWFHWTIAALGVATVAALYRRERTVTAVVAGLFALFFAIGVFMSISASEVVWDRFDALRFLQFPWRYLGLVSFAAAGLAGATLLPLRERPGQLRAIGGAVLVALFVASGWTFFRPYDSCDLSDAEVLGRQPGTRTGSEVCDALIASPWTVAINDYLPKDVKGIPIAPEAPATVVEGQATIVSSDRGSDWLELEVDASRPSTIDASVFDFPDWRVRIDGESTPHRASTPYGLIEFSLPQGRHTVNLQLEDTNVRRAGNLLSLVSWTALVVGVPAWWLSRRMRPTPTPRPLLTEQTDVT